MLSEKLGLKPTEFALANKEMSCDSCGATIFPGVPYVTKQKIREFGGEYEVLKTIECLRLCSTVRQEEQGETSYQFRSLRIHPSWEAFPEFGTEAEHRGLKIVTTRAGTWVATGYENIIKWQTMKGELAFAECSEEQIQRLAFMLDPQNKDSFGKFQSWRTSCGMIVRQYKETDRDMRAGFWYLPLDWLTVYRMQPAFNPKAVGG